VLFVSTFPKLSLGKRVNRAFHLALQHVTARGPHMTSTPEHPPAASPSASYPAFKVFHPFSPISYLQTPNHYLHLRFHLEATAKESPSLPHSSRRPRRETIDQLRSCSISGARVLRGDRRERLCPYEFHLSPANLHATLLPPIRRCSHHRPHLTAGFTRRPPARARERPAAVRCRS
jgi:hypothetical protein